VGTWLVPLQRISAVTSESFRVDSLLFDNSSERNVAATSGCVVEMVASLVIFLHFWHKFVLH